MVRSETIPEPTAELMTKRRIPRASSPSGSCRVRGKRRSSTTAVPAIAAVQGRRWISLLQRIAREAPRYAALPENSVQHPILVFAPHDIVGEEINDRPGDRPYADFVWAVDPVDTSRVPASL